MRSSARARSIPASSGWDKQPASSAITVLGGGTGLAVLLRGLKHHVHPRRLRQLTAVVTVADDGGSSGRLRREFGVPPPGDIRSCIVALADDEDLLTRLFQYRFSAGAGLAGHSFGNLFLTALTGITGDFYQAILTAESILSVRGKILPATLTDVRLRGHGKSGKIYDGESAIGSSAERLTLVELRPANAVPFPPAVSAIEEANLILVGPGSLYTSILPNLLIPGIRRAVRKSPAKVALVMNLMTQPGETDDMSALDHLQAMDRHAGEGLVDYVLVNSADPGADRLAHYAEQGSLPVAVDRAALEERGVAVVEADLLDRGDLIRHDPTKLARAVLLLAARARQQTASGGAAGAVAP